MTVPSTGHVLTLFGKWAVTDPVAAHDLPLGQLSEEESKVILFHLMMMKEGSGPTIASNINLPTLAGFTDGGVEWRLEWTAKDRNEAQAISCASKSGPPAVLEYEPGLLSLCQAPGITSQEALDFRETLVQCPEMVSVVTEFAGGVRTTPLYSAARANNGAACAILIEQGASVTEVCSGGNTAAHVAFYRGNLATFDSLCWAHGSTIDPAAKNTRGERVDADVTIANDRVQEAALCVMRSEQWYFLNTECEWQALPEQPTLASEFSRNPNATAVSVVAKDKQTFEVNFSSAEVLVAHNSTRSPLARFLRVDGTKATVRTVEPRPNIYGWTKLQNVGRGQYFTEVTDLSVYRRLQSAATSVPGGADTGISLELDGVQYRRYPCTWFYRKASNWFPIDPNAANQLTMIRNQGIPQFPTENRVFDLQCMTAFDRDGGTPTQLIQVEQPIPEPLSIPKLAELSRSAADNLAYLATPGRSDAELRQALEGGAGLSANLALIYICLHRLRCLVKGGAIRDAVILSSSDPLKDLDCELIDKSHCTRSDVELLQHVLEHSLGLPTALRNRAAFDNFLGRRTNNPDDLFSMKVLSGPHANVDFELVSPMCTCYYPPRNVDVTVNNLAVSPDALSEIRQLVPLPGAISTHAIVSQLLRGEASPIYDFDWTVSGECVGRAPTEKRAKAMQCRFEKMKQKGLKLVRSSEVSSISSSSSGPLLYF